MPIPTLTHLTAVDGSTITIATRLRDDGQTLRIQVYRNDKGTCIMEGEFRAESPDVVHALLGINAPQARQP